MREYPVIYSKRSCQNPSVVRLRGFSGVHVPFTAQMALEWNGLRGGEGKRTGKWEGNIRCKVEAGVGNKIPFFSSIVYPCTVMLFVKPEVYVKFETETIAPD